ncbi:hypothetical protein I545_6518 [Mycobacterium kansasii 662]|uniref:Uncharacterized protein n=1 Tax=Mycobacterium kansasii 662 TaxID=1299326 RepID=X7YFN6_MYCKA|nr:hypothetical protein I545_6518 [Mycobacterium kansasii 662]
MAAASESSTWRPRGRVDQVDDIRWQRAIIEFGPATRQSRCGRAA